MTAFLIVLTIVVAGSVGFTIGACYEACRRGGTLDLHRQLALLRPLPERSNVRILPQQRHGGDAA